MTSLLTLKIIFCLTLSSLFVFFSIASLSFHSSSLRVLQQLVPVNPFTSTDNATKPGPVVQSSPSTEKEPISVIELISQLQNSQDFGISPEDLETGELSLEFELENGKSYSWALFDYFSHFENTEVSDAFGGNSALTTDEKVCNIDLLAQGTAAYSETLNAGNVNATRIEMPIFDKALDEINYSGTFCQCWIVLWAETNFTGISWVTNIDFDETRDNRNGGRIELSDLLTTDFRCNEVSADFEASSFEVHCYNF